MNDISNWLVHDHRKYDEMLTECEMAAEMADWKDAVRLFNEFKNELKLHMQLEDDILYPLLEQKEADQDNEITELHEEHGNLVRLLRDLVCIIKTKNIDHFMESLLPLHKTMNEHNKHEEAVFIRLASDSVLMHHDEIKAHLSAMQAERSNNPKDREF